MIDADPTRTRARLRRIGIDSRTLARDPVEQIRRWLDDWMATAPVEPMAATLATVGADGRPSVRQVNVVRVDHGPVFFTSYTSRKSEDLDRTPAAALSFAWLELARQAHVEGIATRVPEDDAEAFFASLPREQQLLTWVSDQQRQLDDRSELVRRMDEVHQRFTDAPIPRPATWGGYRVLPTRVELWQGRTDNLHDRFRYTRSREGAAWALARIAP